VELDLSNGYEFNVSSLLRHKRKVADGAKRKVRADRCKNGAGNIGKENEDDDGRKATGERHSDWVHGLGSVVASLEKRFAYHSEEEEDNDEIGETNEEEQAVEGASAGTPQEHESDDNKSGKRKLEDDTKRRWKTKKKAKANKEEQEWLEEGKDLLADDQYLENDFDSNETGIEKELDFDGFYVHRGPLLSQEARKRLKIIVAEKESKAARTAELEDKGDLDIILSIIVEKLEKALEEATTDVSMLPDVFTKRVDEVLLQAAKRAKTPATERIIKSRLHAYFPDLSESTVGKHLERLLAANSLKAERKRYSKSLDDLKEWIEKRLEVCKTEAPFLCHPKEWKDNIEAQTSLSEERLVSLCSKADAQKPNTQSKVTWETVLKKLQAKLDDQTKVTGLGTTEERVARATALGYVNRRTTGGDGELFRWNTEGIALLRRAGVAHKNMYTGASKVWDMEEKLLDRRITRCLTRKLWISKKVLPCWPDKSMTCEEIQSLTEDSFVQAKPKLKIKRSEKGGCAKTGLVGKGVNVSSNKANKGAVASSSKGGKNSSVAKFSKPVTIKIASHGQNIVEGNEGTMPLKGHKFRAFNMETDFNAKDFECSNI